MATKIIHKKSSTASSIPSASSLEPGEIAVNLADKKLYSKQTDGTVVELAPRGDASLLTNVEFTASANQTTFSTTYDVGGIQVFLNGVRLQDSDFTATNGSTIVLASGAAANDVLSVQKFEVAGINVNTAVLTDAEFTATANQTTFTTDYTVGTIQVFLNGIKLQDVDYTATNGTTVVLAVGADAGDLLEVQKFTYAGVYTVNIVDDSTPQLGGDLASNGNDILFADNDKLKFGAGSDLEIYHDGSDSYIKDAGTGNLILQSDHLGVHVQSSSGENIAQFNINDAVKLYFDNSKKFETTSYGTLFTGNSKWADNGKATFGDGDDLQIYHDGSNSVIADTGTGALIIYGSDLVFQQNGSNERMADMAQNGAVRLYYDNSIKLATTSTGVTVTGTVAATAFTGDGSGLTGLGGGVPAGSVIYHAANTAPTGFLKANGAAVSRSTYSDLFTAIGTTFGVGDGSSTFNVPDLRGEFPRGWDDSRGIDSGRSFGSAQSHQMQSHSHSFTGGGNNTGGFSYGKVTATGGGSAFTITTSSQGATSNSSENRPRNIALLACIKY